LVGPNVEYSAVIRVTEASALFCDALAYLDKTKQVCRPFDLSRIDDYKKLQNRDWKPDEKTIEIEAAEAATLLGSAITVFGTEQDESERLPHFERYAFPAFDESGNGEYIYRAQITASGLMPISGLSFAVNTVRFSIWSQISKAATTVRTCGRYLRTCCVLHHPPDSGEAV